MSTIVAGPNVCLARSEPGYPRAMARKQNYRPKPFRPATQSEPQRARDPLAEAANKRLGLQALKTGRCLSFIHDDVRHVVEVHAIGLTTNGRAAMSAYELGAQGSEDAAPGWVQVCFDECSEVGVTIRASSAPRPDYRKGSSQFRWTEAEL
jgi:hypothetical protein